MVGVVAEAAELKVLSAIGMRLVMEDLGPQFERVSGHKLAITFAAGGVTVKRIQDGATADLEQNLENLRRNCYAPHAMCKTNVLCSPGAQPCVPSKATFPIMR
jgi:hypothetical protein